MAENEQYTTIYKPITWKAGDRITGEKLNNLENEVALLSAQVKNAIKSESTSSTSEDQQQYILSQKINNLFSFLQENNSTIPKAARFIVYGEQQEPIQVPTWNELITILKNFAKIYDPKNSTSYKQYDLVLKEQTNTDDQNIKNIQLYQCLQNTTNDSSWNANHWQEISIGTIVSKLNHWLGDNTEKNLAKENLIATIANSYIDTKSKDIKDTDGQVCTLVIAIEPNKSYSIYCPLSDTIRVGVGPAGIGKNNGTFNTVVSSAKVPQEPLIIQTGDNDTCLYIQPFTGKAEDQELDRYKEVLTVTEYHENQDIQPGIQQGQKNIDSNLNQLITLLLQKEVPSYFIYGNVNDAAKYYSPQSSSSETPQVDNTETSQTNDTETSQNNKIDYQKSLLEEEATWNKIASGTKSIYYLEQKINSIPQGKHFFYITDTHWVGSQRKSPILLNYLRNRLGISDCLFGGDILNFSQSSAHAQFVMQHFTKAMRNVFGDHFYPAIGNHDQNLAKVGSSDADSDDSNDENASTIEKRFLSFKKGYDCLFKSLEHKAHTFWDAEYVVYNENTHSFVASTRANTNGERIQQLWSDYQTQIDSSVTDADLEELASYGKMTYYIDDDSQKIRYINAVCTSKPTNKCKWVELFSHDTINALIGWLYKVILSTPKNYDIVYNTHVGPKPNGQLKPIQMAIRHVPTVSVMFMAAKLKSKNKRIPIESSACQLSTYDREFMWPDRTYVYNVTTAKMGDLQLDFSSANDIGQVMIFSGHYHADKIMISNQQQYTNPEDDKSTVGDRKVGWTEYNNGDTLDQTVKQPSGQGCPIPVIYTTADVESQATEGYAKSRTGWYDRYGTQSRPLMKAGTLTEQAFDIVTLTSEGVHFTRIGAGKDRDIKIKYNTVTEQEG